jgi:hypothetical protein
MPEFKASDASLPGAPSEDPDPFGHLEKPPIC